MFRVWGKIIQKNHLIRDTVVVIPGKEMSRTAKVYEALRQICYEFDLAVPVWLDQNKRDFIQVARTRFNRDNFIEGISFDYLDFQVIEEDHPWE